MIVESIVTGRALSTRLGAYLRTLRQRLDFIAEVSDQLLPPAEPNERFFRLIAAVLADLRSAGDGGSYDSSMLGPSRSRRRD